MNQIRPRKVPLPNLDRAAYLERFKKSKEAWSGKTFKHFDTAEQLAAHREQVAKAQAEGAKF